MKTNLLTLVITLTLGIILTGSLLMPVLDDYEDSTYENYTYGGTFLGADIGGEDTTITADLSLSSNTYTVTVNGEDITSLIPANGNQPILMWTEGLIQVAGTNGTDGVLKAYFHDTTSNTNKAISNATHIQVSTASGVLTAILTVGGTDTTYTSDFDWIGYADEDGKQKMILRDTTKPIYFTNVNQIYVAGWTQNAVVSSVGEELTITGSVTGSMTITKTDLGNGAYSTLSTDIDYTINNTAWNPLYLIIPGEVSVQIEGTGVYVSLLSAIPILIIVGLVLAGASVVVRNKE